MKVLDATDRPLGRLASEVAMVLMGKNKPTYQPNVDAGDFVHVKNVGKVKLTGKKAEKKVYKWYTGYQGGLKTEKVDTVPLEEVMRRAVKNMLPKNSHQSTRLRRLRITE